MVSTGFYKKMIRKIKNKYNNIMLYEIKFLENKKNNKNMMSCGMILIIYKNKNRVSTKFFIKI